MDSGERFHVDTTTEEEIDELDGLDCALVPAWVERWGEHNGEAGELLRRLGRLFLRYIADETGNPGPSFISDSENNEPFRRLFMLFVSSLLDNTPIDEFLDNNDD